MGTRTRYIPIVEVLSNALDLTGRGAGMPMRFFMIATSAESAKPEPKGMPRGNH